MKLLILFALIGLSAAAVFQHQLIRVQSQKERMKKEGTWEAYRKYNQKSMKSVVSQPMNDFYDTDYLANITIGTPPQSFVVRITTGSSDFWIPDSSCTDEKLCKIPFYSNESSTYVSNGKTWEIKYGIGYVSGFLGTDVVRLGNAGEEGLAVPNSAVGQATYISDGINYYPANGVLGLAFPSISVENCDPIIFNAYKQGLLDKPVFTVYLEKRGHVEYAPAGVITYGGFDAEHCSSDVEYVNLTSATYYEFQLDSVSLGAANFSDGWTVVSALGTSVIYAPTEIQIQLAKAAGAQPNGTIDCNATFDDLKLKINGKEYTIPAKQLIGVENAGYCTFGIEARDRNDPKWVLGDAWLRSYCNVFGFVDQNIGFAKIIA